MTYRYRFPFPYAPNSLIALVGGTVQPATEADPADPDGGTFDLPDDPDDMVVRAYARIAPDAVPSPPEDEAGEIVPDDGEDAFDDDEDLTDLDDDETEVTDPDAPAYPDDPE